MGWLDKLLGREKESTGEPAAPSTTMEESADEAAGMQEEQGSHEGHGHAPGEPHDHPHDESA
jgi:hypothetical protein